MTRAEMSDDGATWGPHIAACRATHAGLSKVIANLLTGPYRDKNEARHNRGTPPAASPPCGVDVDKPMGVASPQWYYPTAAPGGAQGCAICPALGLESTSSRPNTRIGLCFTVECRTSPQGNAGLMPPQIALLSHGTPCFPRARTQGQRSSPSLNRG
jgi:hypothetical protein